ncbi:MAG: LrgB family protein [Paludibacter sp.]|nr:LrgB family protein [Paludibacter sp.]
MTNIVEHIKTLLGGEVFFLLLTLGSFLLGVLLYKRTKISLLQPLLVSMIIIIPFLKITGIEYQVFYEKTRLLSFMLGPSVVALGYVLYEQIEHIRGNVISILTSVFVGSLVGILSVVLIAKLFGADRLLTASLAPKSVTTPIAMNLAENTGGVPSLAAVFVVICGLFGGLVGPLILHRIGVKSSIAKGLALGSASHALGTVKAMEMGALEGAISGLAIGIMGVMTALLIPFVERFF